MRAGALRRYVTIRRMVTTDDGIGGRTAAPIASGGAWAQIEPLDDRERYHLDKIFFGAAYRVTMRPHSSVTRDVQLVSGAQILRVLGKQWKDDRRDTLVLTCAEETSNG